MADFAARLGVEGVSGAKNAFDTVALAASSLDNAIYSATGGFVKLNKSFTTTIDVFNVASTGFGLVKDAIISIGSAISSTISYGAGIASQFQELGVKFDTIFGAGAGADRALSWAREFGAKTPLTLEQVTDRMIKLKSYGFDPLDGGVKLMEKLGDTTYALGIEFERVLQPLGKMNTTGKVTSEQLIQLAEAGIPVYDILSKKLGIARDRLAEVGKLGLDGKDVALQIADALGTQYAGAMQKASDTAAGAWSTITDLGTEAILSITDQGPWDAFTGYLVEARDRISEFLETEQWKAYAAEIADDLTWGISAIKKFGEALIPVGEGLFKIGGALVDVTRWTAEWADTILSIPGEALDAIFGTSLGEMALMDQQADQMNRLSAAMQKNIEQRKALGDVARSPEYQGGMIINGETLEIEYKLVEDEKQLAKDREKFMREVEKGIKEDKARELKEAADYAKSVDKEAREYLKDKTKEELDLFKQAQAEKKRELEFAARIDKQYYDYRNKLADISYKFEEDRQKTALKRMFEDRNRMQERQEEDFLKTVEDQQSSWLDRERSIEKMLRDRGFGMSESAILGAQFADDREALDRFLEDQRIKDQRAQEDSMKELQKQQDEEQAARDLKRSLETEIMQENTKRMIELATSIKNFKGQVDHRLKILDQSKFVGGFMADVMKRAGVLARVENLQIAGT